MKQLSLVEAKPELNLQQKQVMQGTYHAHCSLRFFGLDRLHLFLNQVFKVRKGLSFKSSHILQYLQTYLDDAELFPNKI